MMIAGRADPDADPLYPLRDAWSTASRNHSRRYAVGATTAGDFKSACITLPRVSSGKLIPVYIENCIKHAERRMFAVPILHRLFGGRAEAEGRRCQG